MILKAHQFRYVISQQQVQYIRDWAIKEYGADQAKRMTDRDKLVAYVADSDVKVSSADESSRLHNKAKYNKDTHEMEYADGNSDQMNYKVLLGSGGHSEFIVDENGNFLNEIDSHKEIEDNTNGIVNGASFNYANANDGTHIQMDVHTAKYLDTSFRDIAGKYKSPNNLNSNIQDGWEDFWGSVQGKGGNGEDWNSSYWNSRGAYSKDGISAHDRVEKERENFRKMIKNY
ncbi:Protein of uncharacterised function (DUF3114) [Streptococcus criceti]|uniref:Uncharacterized protein n=1 Tax=Streptococcus criceti HS-6 TaxID=873449 RepID=G5JNA2_STRCG|nr:DUF3114 domain-containing protein [Streptococcus criceti]EHI73502.1 hypothetical protein STRCR_0139 [Streptococcus criceti HS-6]SUN41651.1 Protein of uncharacterised function (DUF3114) [Streptococcus criceti]